MNSTATENMMAFGTRTIAVSTQATTFLERLAEDLDVPASRYDEARKRYKSVAEWLNREASTLKDYAPDVYCQGSFRLGTPIRPVNEDEHYDVDLVCELAVSKTAMTPETFKQLLGNEMRAYAKAHQMGEVGEGRRCWVLDYAEGAQFHLDALPAIPDGGRKRVLLESRGMNAQWADSAIAITDRDHPSFRVIGSQWPHSNPRGYTEWFRSRMKRAFEARRSAMALVARSSIEDIPSYRVKTPLQLAVQVLKRHRDLMFADDPEHKPISVILTTLSGLAYENESTVAAALAGILTRMDRFVVVKSDGVAWIANPTDPSENFADRWVRHPNRRDNFYRWLAKARADFADLLGREQPYALYEAAKHSLGERPARRALTTTGSPSKTPLTLAQLMPRWAGALSAKHRQSPPWNELRLGTARIVRATWMANGFSRPTPFESDGPPLRKFADLVFEAQVHGVPEPFETYWQVVNTGAEAEAKGQLRGGFDRGYVERGNPKRQESTQYSGVHTIECLVVKNGFLVARNGPFVVNIR